MRRKRFPWRRQTLSELLALTRFPVYGLQEAHPTLKLCFGYDPFTEE